ncbi:MAG TPA: bacillithiol biosynthesis BshC, partial [Gemmatimonadaceae bacterium]
MSDPIVFAESLGGSALSRAARAGELPQWFVPIPKSVDDWRRHARNVIESVPANWLEALEPAISPNGAAGQRLRKSAGGKGLVITTGQQPGLFGGPLMTFVKALSARALADELQQTLNIPVAPVFWAATDDADFDEAASISLAMDGGARELTLEQRSPSGTPVTRVPLGPEVEEMAALLREACGSAAHASTLDAALEAYRDGVTIGDSYVTLLRRILEPLEISVFDVSHAAVAGASRALLGRAAQRAERVATAVRNRDAELTAAGFAPQVDEVSSLAHVFLNEHGTKRRLTLKEAAALELTGDQWLSSTVLVRPALERSLFPTAAYLGGPGETAYFAQVTAVADALEIPKPLVAPRWSMTILEPRVQRILNELGVSAESLADPHTAETQLARARMEPETADALRGLRDGLQVQVDRLAAANHGVVAPTVLDGLRNEMAHRLDRLERRFVSGVKRRETDLMRQVATARGSLYPHGSRQERKLAFVPFLARYGSPLVERMLAGAREHARGIVHGDSSSTKHSADAARASDLESVAGKIDASSVS